MEERGAADSGASLGDRTPCVYFLFLAADKLWFTCHIYRRWWWAHCPLDREPLSFCMRCYTCKKTKFLLSKGPSIGSLLLFVRGSMRVKRLSFSCKLNMTRCLI
jgi:hypothetical protein